MSAHDNLSKEQFSVREAQRYSHLLPEGQSLSNASAGVLTRMVKHGRTHEKKHPELYDEGGYTAGY